MSAGYLEIWVERNSPKGLLANRPSVGNVEPSLSYVVAQVAAFNTSRREKGTA